MKVLVVGRGWTGYKVYDELKANGQEVWLSSHDEALIALKFGQYDWVVNCAGVTGKPNVDACELDPKNTMDGNATYPILLERAVAAAGARFMHWSSGCIYEGKIATAYTRPNFFGSIYSISKGVSDQYLLDKAVVIRIRMPFSSKSETKNLITKLVLYNQNAKLYNAGQNSMTDHDEAVKLSVKFLLDNVSNGPYNLVNQGSMDMVDIAKALNFTPKWFTTEEFKAVTKCSRSTCVIPADNRMRPLSVAFEEAVRKCYW